MKLSNALLNTLIFDKALKISINHEITRVEICLFYAKKNIEIIASCFTDSLPSLLCLIIIFSMLLKSINFIANKINATVEAINKINCQCKMMIIFLVRID